MQTPLSQELADRIILVDNEEQRSNAIKIARMIEDIRKRGGPLAAIGIDLVTAGVDRHGIAAVEVHLNHGLFTASPIRMEFPIGHKDWDYNRIANDIAMAFGAAAADLCLKTIAPDLYNQGMSAVKLTERQTVGQLDLT